MNTHEFPDTLSKIDVRVFRTKDEMGAAAADIRS